MTSASLFTNGLNPPDLDEPALWFIFRGYRLLVARTEQSARIPLINQPADIGLTLIRQQYLGQLNQNGQPFHCLCGEVDENIDPPPGFVFENIRPLYSALDEQIFWLAGRAVQIVDWDRTNQFCGRCGSNTMPHKHERSKICPNCGLTSFPRLAPAVIVRVQKHTSFGPQILLARANRFPTKMFSVLAGFVEPGETLEECVQREIQEEVGITVKNIAYFGSQPWPFPHSLMIAFTADYDAGDIEIDENEVAEAGWFPPNDLPDIPPPPSIANKLILGWLAQNIER